MTGEGVRPAAPERELPADDWEHFQLYRAVREAISCLPAHFRTETRISGIMATDLHTLGGVLGAGIEEQMVRTLNSSRSIWDPTGRYALYSFVRQAQTFPDVLLRGSASEEILLGIELKGWYLLAKEGEPSLRFQQTASACSQQDLVAVVPWILENVISGCPVLFEPFVESAKYAAEYRNWHWQQVRNTSRDRGIESPKNISPYPSKTSHILDVPRSDRGGNFGRLARTGMMVSYKRKLDDVSLFGIKTVYWRQFLKMFQERASDSDDRASLERLKWRVGQAADVPESKTRSALAIIGELERLLDMPE